jgi:hypothetical protein
MSIICPTSVTRTIAFWTCKLEDKQHHIKSLYNMMKKKTEEKEEDEAYSI